MHHATDTQARYDGILTTSSPDPRVFLFFNRRPIFSLAAAILENKKTRPWGEGGRLLRVRVKFKKCGAYFENPQMSHNVSQNQRPNKSCS